MVSETFPGKSKDGYRSSVLDLDALMAEYQTNLTNLKDTWMIDFITGAKNVDTDWDAYIAEMNASGLAEMLEEVRDWFASANAE